MSITSMSAAQIADKWSTKMGQAGPSITAGVNAVKEAPGLAAARASSKWLARVTAAQPKFEKNVSAVTLQSWQSSMINVGIGRVAGGATAAVPKVTAFFTSFIPYLQGNAATLAAMPTDTFEQAMAKAYANAQYIHNYPGYR